MSNAHTPAMMAQSMAESLIRENKALKEQNALLTVQVQPIVESVAKAIYQEWAYQTDYVPWQNGGNSFMQDKARDRARAALATLPQQVKSEDAMDAARYRHVRSGILNCSFIVRQARYDGKWVEMGCDVLDEAIDAAIAAQGSKG